MSAETIVEFVKRHLKLAGRRRFAAISKEAGCSGSLPDKIVSGRRSNPRVQTIQPLVDYFRQIERGERELPLPDIDPRYLPAPVQAQAERAVP